MFSEVLAKLNNKNLKLASAESLTGGLLAASIVDVAGASKVFLGGVVAYNAALKSSLLGVDAGLLSQVGAVDPQVAEQMALGVRTRIAESSGIPFESIVGLATTGVAGPDSQDGKPVGLVYIAISGLGSSEAIELNLNGTREEIRRDAVAAICLELSKRL